MVEFTSSNDVTLELKSGGLTTRLSDLARVAVADYNMTTSENNELVNGIGDARPKGIKRGIITHEFSFTIQGEDFNALQQIALEEAGALYQSREFEFVARGKEITDKMSSGYITELSRGVDTDGVVEYSVSGVALQATMSPRNPN